MMHNQQNYKIKGDQDSMTWCENLKNRPQNSVSKSQSFNKSTDPSVTNIPCSLEWRFKAEMELPPNVIESVEVTRLALDHEWMAYAHVGIFDNENQMK